MNVFTMRMCSREKLTHIFPTAQTAEDLTAEKHNVLFESSIVLKGGRVKCRT